MKIVHVGLDLVPSSGGTVASIRDFSQAVKSSIISFTGPEKLKTEASAIPDTVHVETSPGFLGRSFAWAPEVNRRQALDTINDADLIVCHLLLRYHVHWVKAVAKRKNIPYWVVPHGGLDPYVFSSRSLVKKIWFNLFGRSFLKNAACVIFATEKEKIQAAPYYKGNNCCVIHWPVQALDGARSDFTRKLICRKYGIASDEKILLYLGRLHQSKRPLETITAFAQAKTSGVHLLVVGPEDTISQNDCIGLAKALGADNIHVTGAVYGEEKNDYLLAADAYISLSAKENFGYTTAEALSAGLPVILSPGNALRYDISHLSCGWMLAEDTLASAIGAIKEFAATQKEKLAEMGQRGQQWALAELAKEKYDNNIRLLAHKTVDK